MKNFDMTEIEQKILNGIKYFVKNTNNVGRTKLFKLLFFWDFLNFKKFGKSVTGFDYYTYPFGPVPKELYNEIIEDDLPEYLNDNIIITQKDNEEEDNGYKSFDVKLKNTKIKLDSLSKNELETLEEVAFIYKDATAKQMTEVSHLPNAPWEKTVKEKGYDKIIDYLLAIDESSPYTVEEAQERLELQRELMANGRFL